VIGKSVNGLLDRFNYVMQKKNELQNKGDVFAREYGQKSARRSPEFIRKLDEFKSLMNLSGLVALELDANWENKKRSNRQCIEEGIQGFCAFHERRKLEENRLENGKREHLALFFVFVVFQFF
jgi:hypothetical protein